MMEKIRFIHAADFHIGRFFPYKHDLFLERGRQDRLKVFKKMLQIARERKVDAVFLVGDILEQDALSDEDCSYFLSLIRENASIRFFYLFGNHDFELYEEFSARPLSNLTLFPPGELIYYDDEDLNLRVMGKSWDRSTRKSSLTKETLPIREGAWNICLHHGMFNGQDYFPMNLSEEVLRSLDYIALGHIHRGEKYRDHISMVGTPEPLDHDDVGEKGIIYGEIKETVQTLFLPIAEREVIPLQIRLSEEDDFSTARSKLTEELQSAEDIYPVRFTGKKLDDTIIRALERDFAAKGYYVTISQISGEIYDFTAIYERHQEDVLGEYLRRVEELPLELEEKRKLMAYGVQGLLRKDDADYTGGTY